MAGWWIGGGGGGGQHRLVHRLPQDVGLPLPQLWAEDSGGGSRVGASLHALHQHPLPQHGRHASQPGQRSFPSNGSTGQGPLFAIMIGNVSMSGESFSEASFLFPSSLWRGYDGLAEN